MPESFNSLSYESMLSFDGVSLDEQAAVDTEAKAMKEAMNARENAIFETLSSAAQS
ncbi:hypothetical protein AKJ09_02064 [Labilithrix luteola]|uniref:Uncharacterized protein n=1 Tax=Labilithrix luteola TaxID=1391654 RepID=A0A0K1PPD2_9BACT|nr:hypothetical protein AKJ09_02064 [Labilithrix luteola]